MNSFYNISKHITILYWEQTETYNIIQCCQECFNEVQLRCHVILGSLLILVFVDSKPPPALNIEILNVVLELVLNKARHITVILKIISLRQSGQLSKVHSEADLLAMGRH